MGESTVLSDIPELPDEIIQAGLNGELVLFVGAGISRLLELPSWNELAQMVLHSLQKKGWLNFSELEQLKHLDPKKQLSIARFITEEKKQDFDLTQYFKVKTESNSIYKLINEIGCTCVTTNYDECLIPKLDESKSDGAFSIKPKKVRRIFDKNEFFAKYLDEPGTVIHLHGAISSRESMVVTTKEYLKHYDCESVKHILRELFAKKTVLFIGYGLEETEILEHILRSGAATESTKVRQRLALQGYFRSHESLYKKLHQYYLESFGVHLIGFIRDNNDFAQQENIFKNWTPQIQIRKPSLASDINRINEVLGND